MDEKTKLCKERLPKQGEMLGENEIVFLKAVSEEDKDYMLQVSYECSLLKWEFKDEAFREMLWEEFTDENAENYGIFIKKTGEFVGYCEIKNITKEIPELVIELLEKHRRKGYAYQALSLLMKRFYEITGKNVFRSRIDVDNYASQALHRKLGAIPNGISEVLLPRETLIKFQDFFEKLVDDNMRELAVEFGVNPVELLGHVLEYRIELK